MSPGKSFPFIMSEKLIKEDPGIFTSQSSVPDQMIHNDLMDAQFNTENFRESLKELYENKLSKAKQTLAENNRKWKPGEVENQAAAQAKMETKKSREAQILKLRVAMIAGGHGFWGGAMICNLP